MLTKHVNSQLSCSSCLPPFISPENSIPASAWTAERCTIAKAMEVLSTRSALLILREAFYGTTRFDDFAERVGISEPVDRGAAARAGRRGPARARGLSRAWPAHPPAVPPHAQGRGSVPSARRADALGRPLARRPRRPGRAAPPRLRRARRGLAPVRRRPRARISQRDRRRPPPAGTPRDRVLDRRRRLATGVLDRRR